MKQKRHLFPTRLLRSLITLLCSTGAWAADDIVSSNKTITVDGATYDVPGCLLVSYNITGYTNLTNPEGDNGCAKLFDRDRATKWCYVQNNYGNGVNFPDNLYINFRIPPSSNGTSFIVKGYVLTTGDDTETYSNRNPTEWTLYGSNDQNTWTQIDVHTGGGLPAANTTDVVFTKPNNTAGYQYYRFQVTSVYGKESKDNDNLLDELK